MRTTTIPPIKEDFLHYVWQMKQFNATDLQTTDGRALQIIDAGKLNPNAGPDFLNAKIQLDDLTWHGNIEMHVSPQDWAAHQHGNDPSYKSVILHVVFDAWEQQTDPDADWGKLPTLCLRDRIPQNLINRYWQLQNNAHWIPCQAHLSAVGELTKSAWLDRLLLERLTRRGRDIKTALDQNKGNWEETFWQFLAQNFGANVNAQPFEWLARATPNLLLSKNRHSLFQIEALLFGQSGLLAETDFVDEYPQKLQKEYAFLQKKYNLSPISATVWKFSRLRPANFPTVRLAQLAALVMKSTNLFAQILEMESVETLRKMFDLQVSEYWHSHYRLDKSSVFKQKQMGNDTISLLAINLVTPFLYAYGELHDDEKYIKRAFRFVETVSAENNNVIENWKNLNWVAQSAAESQGLLELKKHYCSEKRCLHCAIGHAILKNN
ncbi:MAG: hypothetical protein RL757_2917 [Bacteroidota bacterium]|jgi:hypothetical protein